MLYIHIIVHILGLYIIYSPDQFYFTLAVCLKDSDHPWWYISNHMGTSPSNGTIGSRENI